eukprot:scaffold27857_cov79-Cyclotella_meneghiniana.AAC.1
MGESCNLSSCKLCWPTRSGMISSREGRKDRKGAVGRNSCVLLSYYLMWHLASGLIILDNLRPVGFSSHRRYQQKLLNENGKVIISAGSFDMLLMLSGRCGEWYILG